MRNRSSLLLLAFVPLLFTVAPRDAANASFMSGAGGAGAAWRLQTAAPASTRSAGIWEGRQAEFETYIRDAAVDRFEEVPIGVTRPKRRDKMKIAIDKLVAAGGEAAVFVTKY